MGTLENNIKELKAGRTIAQLKIEDKKGIKAIVSDLAIREGLNNSETNLREANGFSILVNTYGNDILESFQSFKLNALMN